MVLSDCGSAHRLVGEQGERGRVVPNPLGDPLDVTWDRLKAPAPGLSKVNENDLAEALLDLLASPEGVSSRRAEILRHARRELAPDRVSRAYAELFMRSDAP
jgi:hypothetical protein